MHSEQRHFFSKPSANLLSFDDEPLGLSPLGIALERLVENQLKPAVYVIDSEWGTGKTTFIKMWMSYLNDKNCPIIYFNAWENDFSEDPLASFIGEIDNLLEFMGNKGEKTKKLNDIWSSAKKYGKEILNNIVPILLAYATRGALKTFDVDIQKLNLESDDFEELVQKVAEDCIVNYKKKKESLGFFKKELAKFSKQIKAQHGNRYPLVIIVDELDRCRPDFSVSLLERIKHLFDVDNVVFILSFDYDALSASTTHFYGYKSDKNGYLLRFFDYKFKLPSPNNNKYASYLFKELALSNILETTTLHSLDSEKCNIFVACFAALAELYSLTLREQNRCASAVNMVLRTFIFNISGPPNESNINVNILKFIMPLVVSFIKAKDQYLFDQLKNIKNEDMHLDAFNKAIKTLDENDNSEYYFGQNIIISVLRMISIKKIGSNVGLKRARNDLIIDKNIIENGLLKTAIESIYMGMLACPSSEINRLFGHVELIWYE